MAEIVRVVCDVQEAKMGQLSAFQCQVGPRIRTRRTEGHCFSGSCSADGAYSLQEACRTYAYSDRFSAFTSSPWWKTGLIEGINTLVKIIYHDKPEIYRHNAEKTFHDTRKQDAEIELTGSLPSRPGSVGRQVRWCFW
jgi:hypothetical protein